MRSTFLPYNQALIGQEEIDEVVSALKSGWITTGPRVQEFQKRLQDLTGAKHAMAVDSCTAGLHLALLAYDIGAGDEVIVPDMTFCSTANVVMHVGATPVIADVTRATYHLDAAHLEEKITPKTKAIIPVHYGGQLCDMDAIMAIAKKHNLIVIEDSAHTIDVKYKEQMVGTIGDVTIFSFYATKNLTTAEGGMVLTNHDDIADKIRILTLHGISKDAWKRYSAQGNWYYEVVAEGYKYNMTDIEAALGLRQLDRFPSMMERRRALAQRLTAGLQGIPGVTTPTELSYNQHGWHLYVIEIDPQTAKMNRDTFIDKMKELNIGTSVHFIPLHRHPLYQQRLGVSAEQFPVAEDVFTRIVSLPLYPKMSDQDADDVIAAVRQLLA